MRLYDILRLEDPDFKPDRTKVHLASSDGVDEPIDVYLDGKFDEWQRWQRQKNFERPLVLSLVALPKRDQWLFAGIHESLGRSFDGDRGLFFYELRERPTGAALNGRVVVRFTRPGRQSYLLAEKWQDDIQVIEIRPERMSTAKFPGYRAINISNAELRHIVRLAPETWLAPLSAVAGVYLISDTESGKLYVGSATGEGGIWQRWCDYAATGHGGNKELREILNASGADREKALRYSVLEIADTHASVEDVLKREMHWKAVLLTRPFGLNAN